MTFAPLFKLNNGHTIPCLGLGTRNSQPGEVAEAVKVAIDAGYRHIDDAHVYQNEHEVGQGINQKIAEGVIKRADIFVTSKLWNTFYRPNLVRAACEQTISDLGVSYLDLYLMHWPMAYAEDGALFPTNNKGGTAYSDVDYADTWKEMEKLVEAGLVRSIGVSNFNKKQLERVLEICTIRPVTNQVECHPYLTQKKLSQFCKSKNIVLTAYSPLGPPNHPCSKPEHPKFMEEPKVNKTMNAGRS